MSRFISFLFCMILFAPVKGQSNYTQAIQQGDEAFNRQQYKTAINKYFAAEAFDPSKKEEVKAKVNRAFDAIEALRKQAVADKLKAENALKMADLANLAKLRAVKEKEAIRKDKDELLRSLELIRNTNKLLAQKLIGLSDDADSATKETLKEVQDILANKVVIKDTIKKTGTNYKITVDQIKAICGKYTNAMPVLVEWMNKTCPDYGINSREVYAQFLAQAAYETNGFQYLRQLGSGAMFEGKKSLGNTNPGDGEKYKGRGLFRFVGRYWYKQLGILKGQPDLFIDHPALLEEPEYAVWSACEFWKSKGLNEYSKEPDTDGSKIQIITKKIDGGLMGLELKKKYYDVALEVLK